MDIDESMISPDLQKYIEENILPGYAANDLGHNLDHIRYVIDRSIKFANKVKGIDYDMVYTIAAYHDIGHHIDAKNHEKVSAKILREDVGLRDFFYENQIQIMAEAVEDHRASMQGEPRSVYGKIVSSADRNVLVDAPLRRTYAYRIKHSPDSSLEEIIEESRQHILHKFGRAGYATDKMYFDDPDYEDFLKNISALAEDKVKFEKKFLEINHGGTYRN